MQAETSQRLVLEVICYVMLDLLIQEGSQFTQCHSFKAI